jgi:hypothetical protein
MILQVDQAAPWGEVVKVGAAAALLPTQSHCVVLGLSLHHGLNGLAAAKAFRISAIIVSSPECGHGRLPYLALKVLRGLPHAPMTHVSVWVTALSRVVRSW